MNKSLQLFFFGPATGESIAIHFPDETWGLVDCYIKKPERGLGVLQFLDKHCVKELAFFCLTHPHNDHVLGADHLLRKYRGKIQRLWQWGGLTTKALQVRAIVAAKIRGEKRPASAATAIADGFLDAVEALTDARTVVSEYRRVTNPCVLLTTKEYTISAVRPTDRSVADIEDKILAKNVTDGYLVLRDDEEGALLNDLSIVLLVEYGNSKLILLADAQGAKQPLHLSTSDFSVVKIAHHGSSNGFGADHFRVPPAVQRGAGCVAITPFVSSRLPRREMIERYREAAAHLILTSRRPRRPVRVPPGLHNPRLLNGPGEWHGVNVEPNGKVTVIK